MRGGGISSLSYYFYSVFLAGDFLLPLDFCFCFLVDHTPCKDCTIFPLIVSTACGQHFAAFDYVNTGHVAKFPFLIDLSHVDFTGNPAAACMYRARASTLGRS